MTDSHIFDRIVETLRNQNQFQCVRHFFFSQRVVDIRNSLPNHVAEAESVNSLKRRLDKCKEWDIYSFASFIESDVYKT